MKTFKLTFLLLALLTVAACGDDDEDPIVCGQSDWVGSYSGTRTCLDGGTEGVDVTITANGASSIDVQYETASGSVTTFTEPLPFEGCSLSISSDSGGASLSVEATLSGDELSFRDILVFGGTLDCTITATRN